jgi:cbb3-type cytochrome oxidase subunit 3
MIDAALPLAAAGTTTFAGALTLFLPIGLLIVVLGVWLTALRRGRKVTADAASTPAPGTEEPPPAPQGS